MLFAAGAGAQVIATVEYSDAPPAALTVPRIGDAVAAGDTLVTIHYNSSARLAECRTRILESFVFSDQPVAPEKLIRRLIGSSSPARSSHSE